MEIHFNEVHTPPIPAATVVLLRSGQNGLEVLLQKRHQNLSENTTLTNSVTEIFLHKRAIVDYYKIQNDTNESSLIDSTFISQKQQSVASVNTFSFGGKITRNNFRRE